jgi:DNA-binding XRE family transcriptional regulator
MSSLVSMNSMARDRLPIQSLVTTLETSMLPFKLNASQKLRIQKAKADGKRRVVLKLSESQRKIDEELVVDIEDLIRVELSQATAPSDISGQLRRAREAAGMSLADVAKKADMTRQAVLAIESGKNNNPKIETLQRIAVAVGMKLQVSLST